MGCYGIGITRLVAAAIETLSSKDQMKFPRAISPYKLVIIPQKVRVGKSRYDCTLLSHISIILSLGLCIYELWPLVSV